MILTVTSIAAAQSDTPDDPSSTGETTGEHPWKDQANWQGRRNAFKMKVILEAFDMTAEELRAELSSGKTIMELAEEKGIDLQQVAIDQAEEMLQQAVENGKLTQEEADQKLAEITAKIESGEGFGRPGKDGRLEMLAETLGMSIEDLQAALDEGQTVQEIAESQGVDLEQVAIDKVTERLQQAVENGKLTQEEADQKLAEILEKIESADGNILGRLWNRLRGRGGGFGKLAPAN
jgi:polyhydroxyalkanoate synthesis regulator phasin